MLAKEQAIWEQFQAANPGIFTEVDYNVRVGKGFDPGPTYDDAARQQAILNSQCRIDVVALQDNTWWLIEVKHRCGAGALGQLQQYEILFEQTYPDRRPIKLAMVTDQPKLGCADLCRRHGIVLYITTNPAPFPATT
jgi:hypothetical protein